MVKNTFKEMNDKLNLYIWYEKEMIGCNLTNK